MQPKGVRGSNNSILLEGNIPLIPAIKVSKAYKNRLPSGTDATFLSCS